MWLSIKALCIAGLGLLAVTSHAASQPVPSPDVKISRAVDTVEALHTQLAALMQSVATDLDERKDLIGPTLAQTFDLPAMTKAIYGSRNWRGLDPAQQDAAIQTFTQWMTTQYARRFTSSSEPNFLTGETRDGGLSTVIVETQLRTPNTTVNLDYRTRVVDGDVKIIDIYLDGRVSEVALRRSEFRDTIKTAGLDGFIAALDAKTQALAQ
ncbi:MAG: ABC transporter substrate-binding protein [Pseudomonadota bacterium]